MWPDEAPHGLSTLGFPFLGFATEPSFVGAAVVMAGALTTGFGIRDRSLAWGLSGLLVVCLSGVVYAEPLNAVRAAGMLPVLWAVGRGMPAIEVDLTSEESHRVLLP